jgi:hypothetical protein
MKKPQADRYVECIACPFDDSIDLTIEGDTHVADGTPEAEIFVICRGCRAVGPAGGTVAAAAAAWNRRRASGPITYVDVEVP